MPDKYKYVFRGTTLGFEGGFNSKSTPYTCTSMHPVKALWFALECLYKYPEEAVVYIASTESLDAIEKEINVLGEVENEIGFMIKPAEFYKYCEGYIKIQDLQNLLRQAGWDPYKIVKKEDISRLCSETLSISELDIENLVNNIRQYIKFK